MVGKDTPGLAAMANVYKVRFCVAARCRRSGWGDLLCVPLRETSDLASAERLIATEGAKLEREARSMEELAQCIPMWYEARATRARPPNGSAWDGTAKDIATRFGLRELRVRAPSQCQPPLPHVVMALDDLAASLDVPPDELGLDGTLTIELGDSARQKQGPEFDSAHRTIWLEQGHLGGYGALAHEWFHAFDYVALGRVLGKPLERGTLTEHYSVVRQHACLEKGEMHALLDAAGELIAALSQTRLHARTLCAAEMLGDPRHHWLQDCELVARAFEQDVAMRLQARTGRGNDTLVCFPGPEDLCSPAQRLAVYPYPTRAEGEVLAPHFDALIGAGRACGILRSPR